MNQLNLEVAGKKERLDAWMGSQLPDLSRSRLQKLIEQGYIQLNGQICTNKNTKVGQGDHLKITIPDSQPLELTAEAIELDILYEDEYLIIINKPADLVVHPAPGHESGTLVNALLHHCPNLAGIGGIQRPGIVHRLDKDTTGAIVIAKTDQAHQHLQAQLKTKTARREYMALVHGVPKSETGTIDLPIGRHRSDRQKMAIIAVEKGGRNAVTHWQVKERLGNYTLMEFRLETGRTHQIRVHLSHGGHSIVGDQTYGNNARKIQGSPDYLQEELKKMNHQALHSFYIRFIHPISGIRIEFEKGLPVDYNHLLEVIRKY